MLASGVGLFQSDVLYPDSLRGPPLHSIIVGDVSLSVFSELGNQSYWISMHLLSNPVANRGTSPRVSYRKITFPPELLRCRYNRHHHLLGISINRRVDRSSALRQLILKRTTSRPFEYRAFETRKVGKFWRMDDEFLSSTSGLTLLPVVSRFCNECCNDWRTRELKVKRPVSVIFMSHVDDGEECTV